MWAKMFSRKPAAEPAGEIHIATQLEVREEPEPKPESPQLESEAEAEAEADAQLAGEQTPSPESRKIKSESSPEAQPRPFERPTVSSKRPRSSSGTSEKDVISPLRKRSRRSSFHLGTPKVLTRSPLVRARRVSDGPITKSHPLREESSNEGDPDESLPTPPKSVPFTTLPIGVSAPKPPKRRPRHSYPPADSEKGSGHEGSVISNVTERDSQDFEELTHEGFSFQEAELFQHIRKRGLEPLMPAHWQVDFNTMPDNLFSEPEDPAYIDAVTSDGTFNATAAFQAMVNLGAAVRAKLETAQDAEGKVLFGLKKYIQWSLDDAKQVGKSIQPLIAISTSQEKGAEHCERRMERRLRDLAAELRAEEARLLQDNCPRDSTTSSVVYGLAVAGCVVALITLDARAEYAPTRTLLVVDFSDVTLDFWNAVGIALLVIAARDDELERIDFYESNELKKPVKEGTWHGKLRTKQDVDSDEDK